jgi:hypothetical protein
METCSKILSVVHVEGTTRGYLAMRWQPRKILSTETMAEFLRVLRVERDIECKPVLVSGLPSGVNHST